MKVKRLIKKLKNADPELDVYVWDELAESYTPSTDAEVGLLYQIENGEPVYKNDELVMFPAFLITYTRKETEQ